MAARTDAGLSQADYAAIAAFRFELRRFLAFSERAAAACGLPTQQHQALLAIAGHDRAVPLAIGSLAEQLLIAPGTAAELVGRMVDSGLLTKQFSEVDKRRTELALTEKAEALLGRLTQAHLSELSILEPTLTRALAGLGRARRRIGG